MEKIKIRFNALLKFNKLNDMVKAENIRLLIEDVVNTKDFRTKVLNADFKDRRYVDENNELQIIEDNTVILKKIITGKERYRNENPDNEWDLRIALYRSITKEMGYAEGKTIFTKKRKYRVYSERAIAAHWIHEYMHILGFIHDSKRTQKRPYSIPYLVGSIAKNILEEKEYKFLD